MTIFLKITHHQIKIPVENAKFRMKYIFITNRLENIAELLKKKMSTQKDRYSNEP